MAERARVGDDTNREVRELQEQLDLIPLISFEVYEHVATGSPSTGILTIGWNSSRGIIRGTRPPQVVLVVRAQPSDDPTSNPGNLRPQLNFKLNSSGDIELPEPEGLTANTKYLLTIMFVG